MPPAKTTARYDMKVNKLRNAKAKTFAKWRLITSDFMLEEYPSFENMQHK